jgi:AraC family transcriptional regulator
MPQQKSEVVDHLPVLSSAKSGWENIRVEQYCLPTGESPERELQLHTITIQLGQPLEMEWRLADSHLQNTQMYLGDVSVTPGESSIQTRWHSTAELLLLKLSPTLIECAASESLNTDQIKIIPKWGIRDPQILHIGLALKAEIEAGCLSGRLYGESLGLALAAHILKRYSTSKKAIPQPTGELSKRQLQQVIDYINANLDAKITLTEIASFLGMSPYYFARLFKQSTGLPPHQYLIQRRIEYAKFLLTQSQLPLVEIALRIGSSTQSNFTTLFRKHVGISPKAYREAIK